MNRENAHLYLPLVQALKEGHTIQFSYSPSNQGAQWFDRPDVQFDAPPEYYRVKPKTIRIGDYDVPEPLRVQPKYGDNYFAAWPTAVDHCNEYRWANDQTDERLFVRGLCHATKEAAVLHAKALLSLTQTPTTQS